MHRFKRVGLLLDLSAESKLTIDTAVNLTKTNQGELFIITATREPLDDNHQHAIKQKLSSQIDVAHEYLFIHGIPIQVISQCVIDQSLDIIITAPDQTEGLKRFFYGSLTMSMLRKTPCPIWVVKKTDNDNAYKRVLVCVDPTSDDANKQALNQKLVEIGTSFAERENAECHLMTAWYYYGESSMRGPFINMPEEEIESIITEYKTKTARAFEALQQRNQALLHGCETHLLHGQPEQVIPDFIRDNKIDIVIMGTLARTGVQGFVIGNTAEAVINQLDCSILAVKPDGYKSPLF